MQRDGICYTIPMRIDNSHFRVLVISPLSSVAGRMKLNGIYRFLSEGHDWEIEFIRNESAFTTATFELAASGAFDGFFVGWTETPEMQKLHTRLTIPSVMFDCDAARILSPKRRIVLVHDNAKHIARTAAQHFISQGKCVSFGFVPTPAQAYWSAERFAAFSTEMKRKEMSVALFDKNRQTLEDWLKSLPKPTGVFCASDDLGMSVLQACRKVGENVPESVSVLGVNNDEQICENTRPRLSSIVVDFEELGYRAARELHAMMLSGRTPRENIIKTGTVQIFARASTTKESSAGALIQRALAYIAANATKGITPTDVTRHVRVSRRLLDLRFHEITGKTVQEAIRGERLKAVCHLLKTTDKPIAEIALACGYLDANYLKNQFKRTFGISMRTWRATAS